ncbi:hypothetical protein HKD37_11G030895 [Glycine soja]
MSINVLLPNTTTTGSGFGFGFNIRFPWSSELLTSFIRARTTLLGHYPSLFTNFTLSTSQQKTHFFFFGLEERRMERKVLILCSVVAFLGLLSAATSFGAEATRIKVSQVHFVTPNQCTYPRSPALPLGLIAAVALVLSQIIINVGTGCVCCRKNLQIPDSNWKVALACFEQNNTCSEIKDGLNEKQLELRDPFSQEEVLMNTFTFVIGFLLLLTGAALNDQRGEESVYFGYYYCYVVKPGVFAGGAILSVASAAFGILYYISLTEKNNGIQYPYPNQGVIAMAQPQIPSQTSQEPVFVHEDTYIRRQFT